jgi:hypothetical protein
VSLADLYSEVNVVDAAISPSGRYLAVILRRPADDLLVVIDLKTDAKQAIQRTAPDQAGKNLLMHLTTVYWKTDERLLFRVTIRPDEELVLRLDSPKLPLLGDRLLAINRDGSRWCRCSRAVKMLRSLAPSISAPS